MEQVERIERFPESGAILFESYRRAPRKRFRTSPCSSLATTGLSCSPSWTFVAIPPGSKGRSPRMPNGPENAFVQVRRLSHGSCGSLSRFHFGHTFLCRPGGMGGGPACLYARR